MSEPSGHENAQPHPPKRGRWTLRRILKSLLFLVILLAVVLSSAFFIDAWRINSRGEARRQQLLDRFEQRGIPAVGRRTGAEIITGAWAKLGAALAGDQEAIPDEEPSEETSEEANRLFQGALGLTTSLPDDLDTATEQIPRPGAPIPPDAAQIFRRAMENRHRILDLALTAASHHNVTFELNTSQANPRDDETRVLEQLHEWLRGRSLHHQVRGDVEAALRTDRAMLILATNFRPVPKPSSLTGAIRSACLWTAAESLEHTLSRTEPTAQQLDRFIPLLHRGQQMNDPRPLLRLLCGQWRHRLQRPDQHLHQTLRNTLSLLHNKALGSSRPPGVANTDAPPPHITVAGQLKGTAIRIGADPADGRQLRPDLRWQYRLRLMDHALRPGRLKLHLADEAEQRLDFYDTVRDAPLPEFARRVTEAEEEADSRPGPFLFPWPIMDSQVQSIAMLRAAATAIRIEQYRIQHGRWPDALDDLPEPADNEPPRTDPFTGDSLRYKQTDHGRIVYSLGPNRADDGGRSGFDFEMQREYDDQGFTLIHPDHRGTLAPETEPDDPPESDPDDQPDDNPVEEPAPSP